MPFSSRCMTANDWGTIRHFKMSEFKYPGRMGYEFMRWLDDVREAAGVPMRITSGYRTREHNKEVGGAKGSAHTDEMCEAVDIGGVTNESRARILIAAIKAGCTRWGDYDDNSLHLDRTEDRRPAPRAWKVVGNPA